MDYARDISAKYGLTIENFRTKGSTGGRFKFDFVRTSIHTQKKLRISMLSYESNLFNWGSR